MGDGSPVRGTGTWQVQLRLMHKNIDDAIDGMFQIEKTLLRRKPTLSRWKGYHMANTDKWYFAYTIDGDTITIVDACHAQNMHQP